jgi:hypothetical protein
MGDVEAVGGVEIGFGLTQDMHRIQNIRFPTPIAA